MGLKVGETKWRRGDSKKPLLTDAGADDECWSLDFGGNGAH